MHREVCVSVDISSVREPELAVLRDVACSELTVTVERSSFINVKIAAAVGRNFQPGNMGRQAITRVTRMSLVRV